MSGALITTLLSLLHDGRHRLCRSGSINPIFEDFFNSAHSIARLFSWAIPGAHKVDTSTVSAPVNAVDVAVIYSAFATCHEDILLFFSHISAVIFAAILFVVGY